jgi:uncharacterized protein
MSPAPSHRLWLIHRESGRTVADRVAAAAGFVGRLRGWIGHEPLRGEALWLRCCAAVHTAGLRASVDLVWCGGDGVIMRVEPSVRPWRLAVVRGARDVWELSAGGAHGLTMGDHLDVVGAAPRARPDSATMNQGE